ncbi:MAG: type II 3-dehydroquinate dehydratase [Gammaproteobacteria bacterium]|nr:type II 3-dehydroquinate dehydratase [Gammaproteobacteria bacterium]
MAMLLLLHGPNLNLLGNREPDIYGTTTLAQINCDAEAQCQQAGHQLQILQTNSESKLVERIHNAAAEKVDFIVINPAAFTHTSIAIRDALAATAIPFIEVHLSNTHARESFRRHSYLSDIAQGVVCGLGAYSYTLALQAAMHSLQQAQTNSR